MSERRSSAMRLPPSGYRLHRFPPLAQPVNIEDDFALDEQGWQDTQADVQQQLEAGFQQGLQQGHDEGLRQGIEQGKQQGLLEAERRFPEGVYLWRAVRKTGLCGSGQASQ